MTSTTRFRIVLLAWLAVAIAYAAASVLGDLQLPEELIAYENAIAEQDLTMAEIITAVMCLPLAIAGIVSTIGLYRFRSVARPWAVGVTIAAFPFYIPLGPWIESGTASALGDALMVLWGIILAMMYCPPYADLFVSGDAPRGDNRGDGEPWVATEAAS